MGIRMVTKKKSTKSTKSSKTSTKSSTKSSKKAETQAAAPAAPQATATATETPKEDSVAVLSAQFTDVLSQLRTLRSQLTAVTSQVLALSKRSERELKAAQKLSRKKRKNGAGRTPSGFVKPTAISEELCAFLGKDKGTEMARTEVTREINSYIRAHKLQDPKNGRKILPDKKLTKLLKLKKEDELTYFNLQRYMSHHFTKSSSAKSAKSSQ